jgi:AcrR family transcriptional regulator
VKGGRRARSADAKDERRSDLLDAARRLFGTAEYADVTMADVAAAAGLSKGTTFLYFSTKEALFLELLTRELEGWLGELEAQLRTGDAEPVPRLIVTSLTAHPILLKLLPLLHVTLERNVPDEAVAQWKGRLLTLLAPSAALLENRLGLAEGEGLRFLLRAHALVVGLSQVAHPAPRVHAVLAADPALAGFLIDFAGELEAMLAALVRAINAR